MYEDVLKQVLSWMKQRQKGIIAIDGMCGSGKTTLSEEIESQFNIPVFHLDEYYLPFDKRPKDWQHICAGNMDLARLESEVLIPLVAGEAVHTYRYFCHEGRKERCDVAPTNFAVIEGTYSLYPTLQPYYDLKIFLKISKQEQERRLRKREGDRYPNFVTTWIPMEQHYFDSMQIEKCADFIVEGVNQETMILRNLPR